MAFMIGTVKCQLTNFMGMPTDSGKCKICEEEKTFFGEKSYTRLRNWAEEHTRLHEDR